MYRTSREENEILTRTGRGTPMGEFLRRYWWPVGISVHLKIKPTFVRVLGEDLVLFRDGRGKVGLIGAYCAHRRANLCIGDIERDGVRCRYHGWLYDTEGKCVQMPGEPPDSELKKRIDSLAVVSNRRTRRFDLRLLWAAARPSGAALQLSRRRRRSLHHDSRISELQLAAVR